MKQKRGFWDRPTQIQQTKILTNMQMQFNWWRRAFWYLRLTRWHIGEECACKCKRHGFEPEIRKIPWSRKWLPSLLNNSLPYSCLENSTGRGVWWTAAQGAPGYTPGGCKEFATWRLQRYRLQRVRQTWVQPRTHTQLFDKWWWNNWMSIGKN